MKIKEESMKNRVGIFLWMNTGRCKRYYGKYRQFYNEEILSQKWDLTIFGIWSAWKPLDPLGNERNEKMWHILNNTGKNYKERRKGEMLQNFE